MLKGQLIMISGPSGVGKGTVRKALFNRYEKELSLVFSVSKTTRKPREGEVNGVDYHFVSDEAFQQSIAEGDFLEYAGYVGHYYGTPLGFINQHIDQGDNVLLEIEVQGGLQVLNKRPEVISFFIMPPSVEDLEKRLRNRGTEDPKVIKDRLEKAKEEMTYANNYGHIVVNDTVDQCVDDIVAILSKEL